MKKSAQTEPGVQVIDGQIIVSDRLKALAKAETEKEANAPRKYNKNQSLRLFTYEVYYGDASHDGPNHHGDKQKEFKNLQTAINWIAKETKFYIEEGIDRECYSIVLNGMLIAEY